MVKDSQVRMLMRLIHREKTFETAAAKAGMSDKTARKYRDLGQLPSQCRAIHDWQTRADAFEEDWPWAEELLKNNAGLEAKTLFEALQRERPGQYQDGQLRTFQRRVRRWRVPTRRSSSPRSISRGNGVNRTSRIWGAWM